MAVCNRQNKKHGGKSNTECIDPLPCFFFGEIKNEVDCCNWSATPRGKDANRWKAEEPADTRFPPDSGIRSRSYHYGKYQTAQKKLDTEYPANCSKKTCQNGYKKQHNVSSSCEFAIRSTLFALLKSKSQVRKKCRCTVNFLLGSGCIQLQFPCHALSSPSKQE